MRDLLAGAAYLLRGFGFWRRRPTAMALGLIPAALVALLLLAGFIALGINLPVLTEAVTPFADGWPGPWAAVIRLTAGTAMVGAALVIVAISFTAVTLVIGEPFYDRIWQAVEREEGDAVPDAHYGFWRAAGDGTSLLVRGVGVAIVAGLLGLVPVIGGVVGTVVGVMLAGWLISDELTSRALSARGLDRRARKTLRRANRARVLGFGVAVQLCFLVPLGAVAMMPAAVAGSTMLARTLIARGHGEIDPD